jgi:MFS family permease
LISLIRRRDFGLFWWSSLISGLGNYMLWTALPYYVYASTSSPLAAALTFVSLMIPTVLFSATGGVLADRWQRKPVMVTADFARALLILPILLVHGQDNLWVIYVAAFLEGSVSYFAGPFGNAALPNVVEKTQLTNANAAFQTGGYAAGLVGPAIAGILLASNGLLAIVVADAAAYLASGFLVVRIRSDLEKDRGVYQRPAGHSAIRAGWNEWVEGVRLIMSQAWIASIFLVMVIGFFSSSFAIVAIVPFIRHTLGGSAQIYGWIVAARGLGGILGGLALSRSGAKPPARRIVESLFAVSAITILMAVFRSIPMALVASVAMSAVALPISVGQATLIQAHVPNAFCGRIFGTYLMAGAMVAIVGALISGDLTTSLGAPTMLIVSGSIGILGAVVGVVTLLPATRHLVEEAEISA